MGGKSGLYIGMIRQTGSTSDILRDRWGLPVCAVVAGGLLALALYFVFQGQLNADEGFYLLASRLVRQGFRPYQDFGFTQGPVLPYVNVPWLEIFGYTLDGLRLTCLAWALITVGCGVVWLKRRHSWGAAALFLVVLTGSPVWVAFVVKGKTYAFAGLCVLIGTFALLSSRRLWVRWAVFVAAAGLGIGARYPMAGFFVPAGLGLLILTPGWKAKLSALAFVVICATIELNVAAAGHWDNFLFWTAQFHREALFQFPISRRIVGCLGYAPGVWVVATWAFVLLARGRAQARVLALGSLLVAVVLNVSAPSTYSEYVIPFVPAAVLVAVPMIANLLAARSRALVLLAVGVLLTIGWISPPELTKGILLHAAEAEAFLRDKLPADSSVVGSMPEIAVAAGMRVPPSMVMGKFALTEDYVPEVAQDRMMLTPGMLRKLVADPDTKAVVLSSFASWDFSWSVPSYRAVSMESRNMIRSAINQDYQIAFMNDDYLVFLRKETARSEGNGAESKASPAGWPQEAQEIHR